MRTHSPLPTARVHALNFELIQFNLKLLVVLLLWLRNRLLLQGGGDPHLHRLTQGGGDSLGPICFLVPTPFMSSVTLISKLFVCDGGVHFLE